VELVPVENAGANDRAVFGPNPLMKVPTLLDGGRAVFDSDHIAAHLVRTHADDDRFGVLTQDVDDLNMRAVMNGVMAAEVELILAARGGLDTTLPGRFARDPFSRGSPRGRLALTPTPLPSPTSIRIFSAKDLTSAKAFMTSMHSRPPSPAECRRMPC
jgi:glutathione S-transferase